MPDVPTRRRKLASILESNGWPVASLRSSEQRLLNQKRIYLLQAFGLDLGYRFKSYRKGPYSSQMTEDFAALLKPQPVRGDGVQWATDAQRERYEKFLSFLSGRAGDGPWLEAATSIHLLGVLYTDVTRADILDKMSRKYPHLAKELCVRAWDDLARAGLV